MQTFIDVLIIGASQAGLAAAYHLQQNQVPFMILGREARIGDVWRSRYDSLVLFTPRGYSSLPGLSFKGNPSGYAAKDEVADYLERYAKHFGFPVHLNTEVYTLAKDSDYFKAITNSGEFFAKNVIIATGPFQKPNIPNFAAALSENIYHVHTSQYLNPTELRDGPVLIVGAGNSGAQIAVELSKDREVYLSVGNKMKFLPLEIIGKNIFWWLDKLGVLGASINSKLGQFISRQGDPIFGLELKALIQSGKVKIRPRTESISTDTFTFGDGSKVQVQNVIWATGFLPDFSWIQIPNILSDRSKPIHNRGVSSVEGLYFLGLPWQYRRGSALLCGVGQDAHFIVDQIQKRKFPLKPSNPL